jgi:hypothetical protein
VAGIDKKLCAPKTVEILENYLNYFSNNFLSNIRTYFNLLEEEWNSPVGEAGVIMLEICC